MILDRLRNRYSFCVLPKQSCGITLSGGRSFDGWTYWLSWVWTSERAVVSDLALAVPVGLAFSAVLIGIGSWLV